MSALLLWLFTASAFAAPHCAATPDPDAPLRIVTTEQIPALIEAQRGCVVLLEVYASWCGTCTRTAPAVSAMIDRLRVYGLQTVGVSVDTSAESLQAWRAVRGREYAPVRVDGWTLPGLTEMFKRQGVAFHEAIPLFVLYDRDGRAVLDLTEPADLSALEAQIRALL
ncbi:MAG: TlpA disulfide reductase family protein [Myxococcota bacterium]